MCSEVPTQNRAHLLSRVEPFRELAAMPPSYWTDPFDSGSGFLEWGECLCPTPPRKRAWRLAALEVARARARIDFSRKTTDNEQLKTDN
jgi:hypothetical protein